MLNICYHYRYEPANRQTTADFLVAVTDPNARIPRAGVTNQPRTAAEFAEYFLNSKQGHQNRVELDAYLDEFVGKTDKKEAYIESARAEFAKNTHKSRCVARTLFNFIGFLTLLVQSLSVEHSSTGQDCDAQTSADPHWQ